MNITIDLKMLEVIQKAYPKSYWIEEALVPIKRLWMQKKSECNIFEIKDFWNNILNSNNILKNVVTREIRFDIVVDKEPLKNSSKSFVSITESFIIDVSIIKSIDQDNIKILTMLTPDIFNTIKKYEKIYYGEIKIESVAVKEINIDEIDFFKKTYQSTSYMFFVYLYIPCTNLNFIDIYYEDEIPDFC